MVRVGSALLLVFSFDAAAQTFNDPYPPGEVYLLVQSELNYLEAGDRRISIEIKDASPRDALKQIRVKAQLVVEVKVKLPETPTLEATFHDVRVRDVLEWFAEKVGVIYKVDRGKKLLVLPAPTAGD